MKKIWEGEKGHAKSGQRVEDAGRMGKYVAEGVISEAGSSLLWRRHSNPGIARSGRSKAGIPVP